MEPAVADWLGCDWLAVATTAVSDDHETVAQRTSFSSIDAVPSAEPKFTPVRDMRNESAAASVCGALAGPAEMIGLSKENDHGTVPTICPIVRCTNCFWRSCGPPVPPKAEEMAAQLTALSDVQEVVLQLKPLIRADAVVSTAPKLRPPTTMVGVSVVGEFPSSA